MIASRALAERRNDTQEANRLKEQLLALGVHPSTGQPMGEEEDEEAMREEEERIKEEKAEKKRKALLNQQAIAALKKRTEEDRIKKEKEWVDPYNPATPLALLRVYTKLNLNAEADLVGELPRLQTLHQHRSRDRNELR